MSGAVYGKCVGSPTKVAAVRVCGRSSERSEWESLQGSVFALAMCGDWVSLFLNVCVKPDQATEAQVPSPGIFRR